MKNKGYLLISLGTVLVFTAAIMLFYNYRLENEAQIAADEIVPKLLQQIDQNDENITQEPVLDNPTTSDTSVIQVTPPGEIEMEKYEYIGVLTIPSLQLKLPILATYHYSDMKIAPCRYAGDIQGNLVIAAHNYKAHFGRIYRLSKGEPISFTDTKGVITRYKVELIEELKDSDEDKMVNKKWDLTLFTCNYMGDKRITVRCKKVE